VLKRQLACITTVSSRLFYGGNGLAPGLTHFRTYRGPPMRVLGDSGQGNGRAASRMLVRATGPQDARR